MDFEEKDQAAGEEISAPADKGEDPRWETYLLLHDLAYGLAVVALVFVFLVRLVGVDGSSMFPTLVNRDMLLLESNFLYRNPAQGDVVVVNVESHSQGPLVKRIIATEGQTVDIDFARGEVYVDGVLQAEPYTYERTYNDFAGMGQSYPLTVPEGCIFVMGDNRNNSLDSRAANIGCIDRSRILGKALLILFPGRQTDWLGTVTGGRVFGRIGAISNG